MELCDKVCRFSTTEGPRPLSFICSAFFCDRIGWPILTMMAYEKTSKDHGGLGGLDGVAIGEAIVGYCRVFFWGGWRLCFRAF